jgi:hypothetical protein
MIKRLGVLLGIVATALAGAACADVQCFGPSQDGNTWNLACSASGEGDDDYQCDYFLSVTNSDGFTDQIEATGSVSKGDSGVLIWSAIQHDGSDIVSASIDSGSCSK